MARLVLLVTLLLIIAGVYGCGGGKTEPSQGPIEIRMLPPKQVQSDYFRDKACDRDTSVLFTANLPSVERGCSEAYFRLSFTPNEKWEQKTGGWPHLDHFTADSFVGYPGREGEWIRTSETIKPCHFEILMAMFYLSRLQDQIEQTGECPVDTLLVEAEEVPRPSRDTPSRHEYTCAEVMQVLGDCAETDEAGGHAQEPGPCAWAETIVGTWQYDNRNTPACVVYRPDGTWGAFIDGEEVEGEYGNLWECLDSGDLHWIEGDMRAKVEVNDNDTLTLRFTTRGGSHQQPVMKRAECLPGE